MRRATTQYPPANSILLARTNAPNVTPSARNSQLSGQGQENISPAVQQPTLLKHQQQQHQQLKQHNGARQSGRGEPLDLLKGRVMPAPTKPLSAHASLQKPVAPTPPVLPLQAKVPTGIPTAMPMPAAVPSTKSTAQTADKKHDSTRLASTVGSSKTRISKSKTQSQEWIANMRASLKSSRFFLDSVDNATSTKLARSIASCGAEIAMFLSLSDVTHIITTKVVPTEEEVQRFKEQQKQHQEQQQQQQQQHGHASAMQPTALPQAPQNIILFKALCRNITVWSVAEAIQILTAVTGETTAAQNEPSLRELLLRDRTFGPTTAQNDDYHVFKGVYLLVEDTTGYYQTIIGHEFEPQSEDHPWIRLHWQNTTGSPYVWIQERSKSKHKTEQQQVAAQEEVTAAAVTAPKATTAAAPKVDEQGTAQPQGKDRTFGPPVGDRSLPPPPPRTRKLANDSAPASGIVNSMASHSISTTQSAVSRTTNPLDPSHNLRDPRLEQIGKRVLTTVPVDRVLPPDQIPKQAQLATTNLINKADKNVSATASTRQLDHPTRKSSRQAASAALVSLSASKPNTAVPEVTPGLAAQAPTSQQTLVAHGPNVRNATTEATVDAVPVEPIDNKVTRVKQDNNSQKQTRPRKDSTTKKREDVELPPPTDLGIDEKDLPKPKAGYCENCKVQYASLREHSLTKRHRRYAYDTAKFRDLDQILAKVQRKRRDQKSSRTEHPAPAPALKEQQPISSTPVDTATEKTESDIVAPKAQIENTEKTTAASSCTTTLVDKESSTIVASSVISSQEKHIGQQPMADQGTTVAPSIKDNAEPVSSVKESDDSETKFEKLLVDRPVEDEEATTEPLPQSPEEERKESDDEPPAEAAVAVAVAVAEPNNASAVVNEADEAGEQQEQIEQVEVETIADQDEAQAAFGEQQLDEMQEGSVAPSVQHLRPTVCRFFEQEPQSGLSSSRLETDATVPDEKFLDSAANVPPSVSTDHPPSTAMTPIRLVMRTSSALEPSEGEMNHNTGTNNAPSALAKAGMAKDMEEDDGPLPPMSPDGDTVTDYSDGVDKDGNEAVAMVKSPSAGRGVYPPLGALPSRPRHQPQFLPPSIPASGYNDTSSRYSSSTPMRTPMKLGSTASVEAPPRESRSSTPMMAATPSAFPPSGAFHGPLKRKLDNIMADERAIENELRFQGYVQIDPSSPSAASAPRGAGMISGRWLAARPLVNQSPLTRKSTTFSNRMRGDQGVAAAAGVPPPVSRHLAEFLARGRDVEARREYRQNKENQDPSGRWNSGPPPVVAASYKCVSQVSRPSLPQQQHQHQHQQQDSSQPTTPVKQTGRYYSLDGSVQPPAAPRLSMYGNWPDSNQQGQPDSTLSQPYGLDENVAPTSPTSPAYPPSEGSVRYSGYDSRMSSPISGSPSQRASKRARQVFPVMSHAEQQEERCFRHYQGDRLPEPAGQKMLRTNSSSYAEEFSEYGEDCMVFIE
ncbi:hypothetical protein BGW41_003067 [Actinomortierella wolfii]|nr:hypothetical protein BGW41_003067 [Actinomortierella wolfii]